MHRRIGGENRRRAAKGIDTLAKWNFRAPNSEAFVVVQHGDDVVIAGDERRRHKEIELSRRAVEQRGEVRIGIRAKVGIERVEIEIRLSHWRLRGICHQNGNASGRPWSRTMLNNSTL